MLWFLSLVLSLNCVLSATLMQQWARRYQELAQRRGATHRRSRMRAYISDGLSRFGMGQAPVTTIPRLLHIRIRLPLFRREFLFPIYTTIAYVTLGCISWGKWDLEAFTSPFTVTLIDIVLLFWLKRAWTREYARESMMIWLLPFGHREHQNVG